MRMIFGAIGGMKIGRGNRSNRRKPNWLVSYNTLRCPTWTDDMTQILLGRFEGLPVQCISYCYKCGCKVISITKVFKF
jgi:hypothetical protein